THDLSTVRGALHTAAKILDQVEGEPHATDVLYGISVPKAAAENWPAFAKLVEQMRQGKTTWPVELELVQEWYAPHLDRIYDDGPLRAADIAQLGQIAVSRPRPAATIVDCGDPKSDGGVAGTPNHRSVSVGQGAEISHSRQ